MQHFIGETVRTFAEHTVVSPATTIVVVVVVIGGGVKSVTRTESDMGMSWRRRGDSQTSMVACVILFIVVGALVTEALSAKGVGHKRRHDLSKKRRSERPERSPTSHPHRHRYRTVDLRDAVNLTLCSYSVHHDVVEGRVPRVIQQVKCVENGCRCRVVNNTGTYACTQLVTSVLVTIKNKQKTMSNVPYACVCASKSGVEMSETSPKLIDK